MDKKTYDNIIDEMAKLAKLEYVTDAYNKRQTAWLPYAKLKPMVDEIYQNTDHGNADMTVHATASTLLQLLTVPYHLTKKKNI